MHLVEWKELYHDIGNLGHDHGDLGYCHDSIEYIYDGKGSKDPSTRLAKKHEKDHMSLVNQ